MNTIKVEIPDYLHKLIKPMIKAKMKITYQTLKTQEKILINSKEKLAVFKDCRWVDAEEI